MEAVANGPIYFTDGRVNRVDVGGLTTLTETVVATDLAWSHEASRFATVGSGPNGPIHVTDRDGTRSVELTDGYAPAWSPDGTQIAFVRMNKVDDPNGSEIWLINPDGSDERALTHTPQLRETSPSWAPDGMRVLLTRWATDGSEDLIGYLPEIVEVQLRSGELEVLGLGERASYSPNGTWIAVSNCPGIAVLGVELRVEIHSIRSAACVMPDWSPDGRYLAFAMGAHVAVLEVATGSVTELPAYPEVVSVVSLTWSPDGRQLAFVVTLPCAECFEGSQRGALLVQEASDVADPRLIPHAAPGGALAWPAAQP